MLGKLRCGFFTMLMGSLLYLFLLLLITICCEMGSLSFLVLLTVTFVFLSVRVSSALLPCSLTSFLVSVLFCIVGVFLTTSSMLVFFIMYEFSLIPVCHLIFLFGYQPEKIKASLFLLSYTILCSAPFLYFTITLATSLSLGFSEMSAFARLLVCLSFMVKSPLYSLHVWLPKAHVEAPLLGSMLLAGVILKLGRFGLILLSPCLSSLTSIFVYLTLSGGVVCSGLCCRNWDMKSLVAYSSVVHMGVITLGALSGLELGSCIAVGILIGHSLLSPLMFLLAFELYLSSGSRSFASCYSRSASPSLLLCLSLCSGINFGLPPFLNF